MKLGSIGMRVECPQSTEGQTAASPQQKDRSAFEIQPYSSKLQPAQPEAARSVKETGVIQVRDERQKGISVKEKEASVIHDVYDSTTLLCFHTRLLAVTFLLSIFDSHRNRKTCSCSSDYISLAILMFSLCAGARSL
jgi:hypothetical protein